MENRYCFWLNPPDFHQILQVRRALKEHGWTGSRFLLGQPQDLVSGPAERAVNLFNIIWCTYCIEIGISNIDR